MTATESRGPRGQGTGSRAASATHGTGGWRSGGWTAGRGANGDTGGAHADSAGATARTGGLTSDAGGATAFACIALAALIALTLLISQVGVAVVARHRAQAAADLGALAAVGLLVEGPEAGCAQATELARRMGARVARCVVEHWDVEVTVEVTVTLGIFGNRTVRVAARAGPVDDTA
ncbi:Rv3654c family TadE-like protein [Nocardia mangyaensis]|uniref:Rv3654c family TadE-like protein n=1 Tax=Nocardia mangyaensis TaxID=2213200 RepID=UPI002675EFF3|nr:Rv3654c family TadE-like protein [Nocardia mangyaensis]MDO3650712.1 flp pilus-assembly TadE/G-like family protein [Nocardia mangyaensis]